MREINISQGLKTLVDDEDFARLNSFRWYAKRDRHTFYVGRTVRPIREKRRIVLMHREIITLKIGEQVDHIDRNGLNNQRSNLRIATIQQNAWNSGLYKSTTGFKGVSFDSRVNRFRASLMHNGRNITVGYFDDAITAAHAYDRVALNLHGEFAYLNFQTEAF